MRKSQLQNNFALGGNKPRWKMGGQQQAWRIKNCSLELRKFIRGGWDVNTETAEKNTKSQKKKIPAKKDRPGRYATREQELRQWT